MAEPEIDRRQVQELATLARLALPPDREALVQQRLGRILRAFAALREVDTRGVEPSPYPVPLLAPLRLDQAGRPLPQEQVLANASRTAASAFLVPPVLEA